jgi:uncharacterized protein (TIGR03118 family)
MLCLAGMALPGLASQAAAQEYIQSNLVSDVTGMAAHTDPNLKNPWGFSFFPNNPFWVSDNGTGVTTLYDGTGTPQFQPNPLIVNIPGPQGSNGFVGPTGQVANGTPDFQIAPNIPPFFIFTTLTGTISAWHPNVNQHSAIRMVDNSRFGAIYTGMALGSDEGANFLYLANFHSGKVEVYDGNYHRVYLQLHAFQDDQLPRGYAPFNIENIGGLLYVTYAKQNPDRSFSKSGPGLGYVDVYTADGALIQRLEHGFWLNAPWGVALAPDSFGFFGGDILVGQFGSGRIAAFDPNSGEFEGFVLDTMDNLLTIPGLWGIHFGAGGASGDPKSLYFAAGINAGRDGLFGSLSPDRGHFLFRDWLRAAHPKLWVNQ